ncbi:RNA-dependent RNA polymerase [Fusagravirus kyu]|uniref:RNA-directed RNA polymerase n=1 Tax=Papaya meleira virus TaxID=1497848 RepID=A0A172JTZ1_9VIRU|nr:RNA-dependent RNA polymerase [Papaya meleira virus]
MSLKEFPDLNLMVEGIINKFTIKLSGIETLPFLSNTDILLVNVKDYLAQYPLTDNNYNYREDNFRNILNWIMIEPLPREIYSYLPNKLFKMIKDFVIFDIVEYLPKLNNYIRSLLTNNIIEIPSYVFLKPTGRLGGKTHLLLGDLLELYGFKFSNLNDSDEKEGILPIYVEINKNRLYNNINLVDISHLFKLNKDNVLLSDLIYTLISLLLYQLSFMLYEDWNSINVAGLFISPISSPLGFIPLLFFIVSEIIKFPILDASKICKRFQNTIRVAGRIPFINILITQESEYVLDRELGILNVEGIRMLYGIESLLGPSEYYKFEPISEIITRQVSPNLELSLYKGGSRGNNTYSTTIESINRREENIRKDMYNSMFFSIVKRIHRPFKTFRDWFKVKFSWSASGGCPGAKVNWSADERIRVNKRGALLNVSVEEVVKAINDSFLNPVHYSKAARKYEKGKNRVIWNTSLLMYLAQSYLLYTFESVLDPLQHDQSFELNQISSWNASTANADLRFISNRERLLSLNNHCGLMFDYSDFNINHSIIVQNKLYDVLSQVLMNKMKVNQENYPQVIKDIKWLTEYVMRAKTFTVLDAGIEDNYISKVMRSLESGERGTSFINTFLSNCYIRNLNTNALNLLGNKLLINNLWLQGDDVFSVTNSLENSAMAVNLFNCLGYAGQPFKIGLSYHNNGEFLRLSYDPKNKTIGGYPIRSCAGLVSGEFFKESVYDPDVRAGCYLNSIIRCNIRGAIIPNKLMFLLAKRNCKLVYTIPENNIKIRMIGDPTLALLPSILGGFGINSILDIGMKHQVISTDQLLNRLNFSPGYLRHGWFSKKVNAIKYPRDSFSINNLFWIRRNKESTNTVNNNQLFSYYILKTDTNTPTLKFDKIPDVLGDKNIPDYFSAYLINPQKSYTKAITQNIIKSSVMGALPKELLSRSLTAYGAEHYKYRHKIQVGWDKYTTHFDKSYLKLNYIMVYMNTFIDFIIECDNPRKEDNFSISVNLNYGILPSLFIEYGFSLQENFERVLDGLNNREILDLIASVQHHKFNVSTFYRNILSLNKYNSLLYIRWIRGKILLFPPCFNLIDSDIINIWRGWSLLLIEKMILNGIHLVESDIPYLVLELELLIEQYIKERLQSVNKLNEFYSIQTKA